MRGAKKTVSNVCKGNYQRIITDINELHFHHDAGGRNSSIKKSGKDKGKTMCTCRGKPVDIPLGGNRNEWNILKDSEGTESQRNRTLEATENMHPKQTP